MSRLRSASVGGDAHNDDTSSGTSLIVNELLTYVFDAHTNHPADTIKQNVLNFYSNTAIHDAKLALWNAYERHLPKPTKRRGPNQSTRELADILVSIDGIDRLFFNSDTLPVVFVAVNLRNLPREQHKDNVIEDILARLKRIVMREACAPTPTLADPEGGLRGLQPPPLNFQKRGVTSVVISTVSTVSEQERNGQGRRDVGKSVHVRQAIMQLDAYHVRRGFVQKTANKVVYNDGKHLHFAYPFLDVAALMDLLYISRSSVVRPTLHSQVIPDVTTSFSQYIWSSYVSLALYFSF